MTQSKLVGLLLVIAIAASGCARVAFVGSPQRTAAPVVADNPIACAMDVAADRGFHATSGGVNDGQVTLTRDRPWSGIDIAYEAVLRAYTLFLLGYNRIEQDRLYVTAPQDQLTIEVTGVRTTGTVAGASGYAEETSAAIVDRCSPTAESP